MPVFLFGAGGGIRTPVGFHPNGFQDRLVMTASIFLRIVYEIVLYIPNGMTLVASLFRRVAPFTTRLYYARFDILAYSL